MKEPMMLIRRIFLLALMPFVGNLLFASGAVAAEAVAGRLFVGGATISITPDERVALAGQMRTRISTKVEAPCLATALAIETRNGDQSLDQAVFVSCDLVALRPEDLFDLVRNQVQGRVPDSLLNKIVMNATHTHTGPVTQSGTYEIPESGVMHPDAYLEFLVHQLGDAIVQAWDKREAASVAWGLGEAVVAHNRRAVYANGTSVMYGNSNTPNFRGIEGAEDHGVELLYFWNTEGKLIATSINVACPSQEAEHRSTINADFWHPVRETLKKTHGDQLHILTWTGAAGDQSPHLIYRKEAESRMRNLRGIDSLNEIARRIVNTWEDVYQLVQQDQHEELVFEHQVKAVQLPFRKITALEASAAKRSAEALADSKAANAFVTRKWHQRTVDRFEQQQAGESPTFPVNLHVIRLGDVAIATNPFELFTDYGVQIKSRSPALQTFIIQLSQGSGGYLATERAVAGGGYSAIPQSGAVGPEGGQMLVEESVQLIRSLWPSPEKVSQKINP